MLAVGVDDEPVEPGLRGPVPEPLDAVRVQRRRELGALERHADVGKLDGREPDPGHGRALTAPAASTAPRPGSRG